MILEKYKMQQKKQGSNVLTLLTAMLPHLFNWLGTVVSFSSCIARANKPQHFVCPLSHANGIKAAVLGCLGPTLLHLRQHQKEGRRPKTTEDTKAAVIWKQNFFYRDCTRCTQCTTLHLLHLFTSKSHEKQSLQVASSSVTP